MDSLWFTRIDLEGFYGPLSDPHVRGIPVEVFELVVRVTSSTFEMPKVPCPDIFRGLMAVEPTLI